MKPTNQKWKKLLVFTMVPIGLSAFVLKLGLFWYWLSRCPTVPRTETGETYALNNHGHIFYVTQTQGLLQVLLTWVAIAFFFGGALLNLRWKVVRNPYDDIPKKMY